jgi:hypothetical protein
VLQVSISIVRQVVGYDRFVGVQPCQQLSELYRALHLSINCFQPSMKLQGKYYDGRKVRLAYDLAKTSLQRLLLSEVLPVFKEQAWKEMFQELDPVRLFEQVKELQQALFLHMTGVSPHAKEVTSVPVQRFSVEGCTTGSSVAEVLASEMVCLSPQNSDALPSTSTLLAWHRTCNDPFNDTWKLIASWVVVHPERTSGEILRELQRLFPEGWARSEHDCELQKWCSGRRREPRQICPIGHPHWNREQGTEVCLMEPLRSSPA